MASPYISQRKVTYAAPILLLFAGGCPSLFTKRIAFGADMFVAAALIVLPGASTVVYPRDEQETSGCAHKTTLACSNRLRLPLRCMLVVLFVVCVDWQALCLCRDFKPCDDK